MLLVLISFGTFYSFLEIFFEVRTINFSIILKSVLNTIQGKTWDHMWYIYMLIGLYIVTPALRIVINNSNLNNIFEMIVVLVIGTTLIPTINNIFDLKIENFMLISNAIILYYIILQDIILYYLIRQKIARKYIVYQYFLAW